MPRATIGPRYPIRGGAPAPRDGRAAATASRATPGSLPQSASSARGMACETTISGQADFATACRLRASRCAASAGRPSATASRARPPSMTVSAVELRTVRKAVLRCSPASAHRPSAKSERAVKNRLTAPWSPAIPRAAAYAAPRRPAGTASSNRPASARISLSSEPGLGQAGMQVELNSDRAGVRDSPSGRPRCRRGRASARASCSRASNSTRRGAVKSRPTAASAPLPADGAVMARASPTASSRNGTATAARSNATYIEPSWARARARAGEGGSRGIWSTATRVSSRAASRSR